MRYLPVQHSGNRTLSTEEVDRVNQSFRALVGLAWTDREGATRPIAVEDVLVVAPYNAQVRCLRGHLPADVPVGTVDKFQGGEAPGGLPPFDGAPSPPSRPNNVPPARSSSARGWFDLTPPSLLPIAA